MLFKKIHTFVRKIRFDCKKILKYPDQKCTRNQMKSRVPLGKSVEMFEKKENEVKRVLWKQSRFYIKLHQMFWFKCHSSELVNELSFQINVNILTCTLLKNIKIQEPNMLKCTVNVKFVLTYNVFMMKYFCIIYWTPNILIWPHFKISLTFYVYTFIDFRYPCKY